MTRDELIRSLVDKQRNAAYSNMALAIKHLIQTMADGLAAGQRIEIRDFGSFAVRTHPARTARNPKTGEQVLISSRRTVHFKPGKELKERANSVSIPVYD